MHTSFKKGLSALPIDIDQFAVDLHNFFKLSSARHKDYSSMEELANITSKYLLRHSSVRWPTLKYVLVRIIEQWENLKKYFLSFLPKLKDFKRYVKDKGLKKVQKHRGAFERSINTTVLGLYCISVKPVWNFSYHISVRKAAYSLVVQWNEHLAN